LALLAVNAFELAGLGCINESLRHCGGFEDLKPITLGAYLAGLLSVALPGQGLFYAFLLAGFQVEGVFLYVFDDVLLLYLTLETPQRAFQGLALLHDNFSQ
jgi:hypothetical protein